MTTKQDKVPVEVMDDAPLAMPTIEYFTGRSPKDILDQLEQIKLPYNVLGAYSMNSRHYLVVNLSRKIKKIIRSK